MKNPLGIQLTESVLDEKVSYAEYAPKSKPKAASAKGAYGPGGGWSTRTDANVVANAAKFIKSLTPEQIKQLKQKNIGWYRALIAASQGMDAYYEYIQSLSNKKNQGWGADPAKRKEYAGAESLWSELGRAKLGKKVRTPIGEILMQEDSPLEAPVATFNRHAKLMSPATRELVLRSRMTEIEAFSIDRGYNPALVSAVAEVAMRTGRIPELRQYGFSGDDAKAVKHFISGDVLNNYAEDEEITEGRSSPEVMQKFYDLMDKKMQKIVALQDEPGELTRFLIRLAQQAGMDKLQALGPAVIHAAKYAKKGKLKRIAQGESLDEDLKKQMLDSVLGLLKQGLEMHKGDKKKAIAFAKKHSTAGPAIWKLAFKQLNLKESLSYGDYLAEVSPPGFSGTVKAMKDRHGDEIDNPHALAWSMFKKGAKPKIKPEADPKGIKKYISPEKYAKYKKNQ